MGWFNQKKYDLEKYQLVILGGGGIYHPDHLKSLEANTNLYSSQTPLAIVGVGLNLDGSQQFSTSDKKRLIRLVNRSFVNSVRDQWSMDFLNKLKLKSTITGCPSLFLPELLNLKASPANRLIVNIALSHTRHFQSNSAKTLKFIDRVIKQLPYEIIIVCHAKKEKKLFKSIFPNSNVFYSSSPKKVFSIYKNSSLVIGMRGHSQIFALAVNTPSIAIPLNKKVAEPVKMTLPNSKPLLLSLNQSLPATLNKISFALNNQIRIKSKQQQLKKKLKANFLNTIKHIYENSLLS